MNQPNQKVWHLRIQKHPKQEGEKPFEYARRLSKIYNTSFNNTRNKIRVHLKNQVEEQNTKEIIPIIDNEGIDYGEVKHGWVKTKANDKGRSHSLFFKVGHEGDFLDNLIEGLKGYKFEVPKFGINTTTEENIAIINLADLHLDKLCIIDTTNSESSLEKNILVAKSAFKLLIDKCVAVGIERLYMPFGNDILNADNPQNTTFGGTPQDSFFDWKQSFNAALAFLRWSIDYSLSLGIPVDARAVYCNHAPTKLFYLARSLDLVYENTPNVKIEYQELQRTYYTYGENLFGVVHGDREKVNTLPTLMALEQKEQWGKTTHRTWLLGHLHTGKAYIAKTSEDNSGVEMIWLRSLSSTDKWHHKQGYVGCPKSAQAFIFNKIKGMTCTFRETF